MRIEVATGNRSLHEFGKHFMRGETYEVDDKLGARLLGTGRFRLATLPAPDPLAEAKERAEELVARMASAGPDFMDRLERFMKVAEGEAVAAAKAAANKDEPGDRVVVTNDVPRTQGATALDDEADEDLADMTVAQLKALARDRGVELGDARRKADIIAALRNA